MVSPQLEQPCLNVWVLHLRTFLEPKAPQNSSWCTLLDLCCVMCTTTWPTCKCTQLQMRKWLAPRFNVGCLPSITMGMIPQVNCVTFVFPLLEPFQGEITYTSNYWHWSHALGVVPNRWHTSLVPFPLKLSRDSISLFSSPSGSGSCWSAGP